MRRDDDQRPARRATGSGSHGAGRIDSWDKVRDFRTAGRPLPAGERQLRDKLLGRRFAMASAS